MSDLDQLERLLAEATPGPWLPDDEFERTRRQFGVTIATEASPTGSGRANAAIIVAMREALPGLIAEVRVGREATFRLRSIAHRLRAITPGPNSGSLSAEDYMDRVESMLTDAESRGLTRGRAEGLAAAAHLVDEDMGAPPYLAEEIRAMSEHVLHGNNLEILARMPDAAR